MFDKEDRRLEVGKAEFGPKENGYSITNNNTNYIIEQPVKVTDPVVHPEYYGDKEDPYEVIKVINAWKLCFNLGNVAKYIARCGKKENNSTLQDLKKARFYLDDKIAFLEKLEASKNHK